MNKLIITYNCGKCGLIMDKRKRKGKTILKCPECKIPFVEGEF